MRYVLAFCVSLAFFLTSPFAKAEKRFALLIGNQGYPAEIGRLANPHNDVALLGQVLNSLGFEVTIVRDAGLAILHHAVNGHVRRVGAAGAGAVSFVYYSGHGAQDAGNNYLIPVDVVSAESSELWDRSLRLTEITRKLKSESDSAMHFVVFDACRNSLKLKKAGTRALVQSKGFVPVRQETGMLIAFATAEGELASDVGEGAGPYAKVLAEEIVKPGVEAVTMFRQVQLRVRTAVGQEPWLGFSTLREVHFAGAQARQTAPSQSAPATQVQLSEAERAWKQVERSSDIRDLEAFRRQYGNTNPFYDRRAERRIEELRKAQVAIVAPPREPGPVSPGSRPPTAGWVELGCKDVSTFGNNRDSIIVGRRAGRFKAIRLHVRSADVEMLDLKVIYAVGEPDDIPVRHLIRQGERTRPLDLRGYERSINRVDIAYRTASSSKGVANVCVEGLQ